jgi:hypothetical protein
VRRDSAGKIKLDKEKSRNKIAGMAALVNVAGVINHPSEVPSVDEQRGVLNEDLGHIARNRRVLMFPSELASSLLRIAGPDARNKAAT